MVNAVIVTSVQVIGLVDNIPPVKELFNRMMGDTRGQSVGAGLERQLNRGGLR